MDTFLKTTIAGFILGVFISSIFSLGDVFLCLVLILLAFVILAMSLFLEKKSFFIFSAVFVLSLALGVFRFISSNLKPLDFTTKEITLTGYISEEPDERENNTRLIVESETHGRTMVYARRYPQFRYGNKVELTGKLKKPEGFVDDKGKFFDWTAYLAKDGIGSEMIYPKIRKTDGVGGNFMVRGLLNLKARFIESLRENIPEPEASLSSGVTIGARSSLPHEVENDFRLSGLSHIVVVSGYNVSLVADYLSRLFTFFSANAGFIFGFFGVVAFTFITGASATVVRASVMALLVLLARKTGRMYAAPRALCIAGFLMILENPKLLVFDLSFQLSFLATLGIMVASKPLEERFSRVPSFLGVREVTSTTLSAQVFVFPLIAYKMGTISLSGVMANIFVLVTLPPLMFFSTLAGLTGIFFETISKPFAYVSYVISHYIILVSHYTALLPYGSITVDDFSLWLTIIIYGAIFSGLFFLIKLNKKRKQSLNE